MEDEDEAADVHAQALLWLGIACQERLDNEQPNAMELQYCQDLYGEPWEVFRARNLPGDLPTPHDMRVWYAPVGELNADEALKRALDDVRDNCPSSVTQTVSLPGDKALVAGRRVQVGGLIKQPDLNGRQGVVQQQLPPTVCYRACLCLARRLQETPGLQRSKLARAACAGRRK